MLSRSNNSSDAFDMTLWRQLKLRFNNSLNVASLERNNIQTGLLICVVLKKNEKIRVCIDFRDLNIACPKNEFPLLITDVMIDNTCGFERISFMDGFSRYNQIKMYPEDEKHISF